MIRRSVQMNSDLQRAREHQKYRESLSMTLPGYDTAMNTASKILNLTQDDLDEIMSTADDSFQVGLSRVSETENENRFSDCLKAVTKHDATDGNERIRQKVTQLLASQEEFSSKLLKMFSKKLDEIQATDRQLAALRQT